MYYQYKHSSKGNRGMFRMLVGEGTGDLTPKKLTEGDKFLTVSPSILQSKKTSSKICQKWAYLSR